MTVTAGDLVADEALRDGRVIGGAAGLDGVVRQILLVTDGPELDDAPFGTGAVLDLGGVTGANRRQHLAEIVCRRLHGRGGHLLVIAGGPFASSLSTTRLADRLALPVIAVPEASNASPAAITARLLTVVHEPEAIVGRTIATGASRLRTADTLERALTALDATLDARTAVVTADGTPVAGQAPRRPYTIPTGRTVPQTDRSGRVSTALCPVPGTAEGARLWLVCQSESTGPLWRDTALGLMDVAGAYVSARFAAERLTAERDARVRGGLLTEILRLDGPPPAHLAGQAARLGWRLDGWHTGVHFALIGADIAPPAVTPVLAAALAGRGLDVPLVERAGGWSSWHTDDGKPTALSALATAVRRALADYHKDEGVPRLVAGVGRPAAGPEGVATTLSEAQRAATVAAVGRRPGVVQRSDELGAKQILLDWYGSSVVREEAEQMLAPLLSEGDEGLLETVEAYLDAGCSPSETATRLGLHRNTVTRRIRKAESLLGVPFVDPDDRLAIHLACRMHRLANT
jgi:hypothetical protein